MESSKSYKDFVQPKDLTTQDDEVLNHVLWSGGISL